MASAMALVIKNGLILRRWGQWHGDWLENAYNGDLFMEMVSPLPESRYRAALGIGNNRFDLYFQRLPLH
jgi:hypothetical protein